MEIFDMISGIIVIGVFFIAIGNFAYGMYKGKFEYILVGLVLLVLINLGDTNTTVRNNRDLIKQLIKNDSLIVDVIEKDK